MPLKLLPAGKPKIALNKKMSGGMQPEFAIMHAESALRELIILSRGKI